MRVAALGLGLVALSPLVAEHAQAARPHPSTSRPAPAAAHKTLPIVKVSARTTVPGKSAPRVTRVTTGKQTLLKGGKARYATRSYGGISCVPFARAASGIQLKGNAANWWDNAGGVYARGQAPEDGSVLNFRATGHMRLGHVAVVSRVLSSREIEIDHANWAGPGAGKGGVSRGVSVIDVSSNNDWSAVRVGLGHTGNYGSVYPTYGFIYDRPDSAYASARPAQSFNYDEVAEAPARAFR